MFQLKELTQINAVSGNEEAMRKKIIDMVSPYATEVSVDTMGNVIAYKKGTSTTGKKLILSAHMDEVGFIVSDITDDGYVKFKSVGGIDERIMLAQRVLVGQNQIPGVMGIKAVHLQSPDERKSIVKEKDMYIDIGATNKEAAEKIVSKGDYIAFDSPYREAGDSMIKAKALDDRVGCAILAELIKGTYPNDIWFCFCVQEEVGCRGATVIARRLRADAAIVLESTTASDTPATPKHQRASCVGEGTVVSVMDRGSYSDRALNDFVISLAKEHKTNFQYKKSGFGGNDARAYQTSSLPCRTTALSIPCRYIHSPVSCAKKEDILSLFELAQLVAQNIHTFFESH